MEDNKFYPVTQWSSIPELYFKGIGLNQPINGIGGTTTIMRMTDTMYQDLLTQYTRSGMKNSPPTHVAFIDIGVDVFGRIDFNTLISNVIVNGKDLNTIRGLQLYVGEMMVDQENSTVNTLNMKGASCNSSYKIRNSVNTLMQGHKGFMSLAVKPQKICYDVSLINEGKYKNGNHYGKVIFRIMLLFNEASNVVEGQSITFEGFITYLNDITSGFRSNNRKLDSGKTKQYSKQHSNVYSEFFRNKGF